MAHEGFCPSAGCWGEPQYSPSELQAGFRGYGLN